MKIGLYKKIGKINFSIFLKFLLFSILKGNSTKSIREKSFSLPNLNLINKTKEKILKENLNLNGNIINNYKLFNFKIKNKKYSNLKKNLVIGAFIKYNWDTIEPFFNSFIKAGFSNCDCIMFIRDISKDIIFKMKSYGVTILKIPDKFKNMKIINYRWKIYEDFLKDKKDKYNLVFTADIRDVFFQNNIFNFYQNIQPFLGISLEDGTLSQKINKKWIIKAYGEKIYKIIKNERIICVGTIWGTTDKFYEFSKIMWKKLSSNWSLKNNVIEQAVCNYLIYIEKLFNDCLKISKNRDGPVMTIGLTKRENIKMDSQNNILNENGQIASVIHQYDRKKDIVKIVRFKYRTQTKNINKINNNSINQLKPYHLIILGKIYLIFIVTIILIYLIKGIICIYKKHYIKKLIENFDVNSLDII